MLYKRRTALKDVNDYTQVVSPKEIDFLKKTALKIKGKKIIHINATPKGGGVAEILKSQVPLERSLGIDSHWYYLKADDKFFKITKKIHNALQGLKISLTFEEKDYYLKVNQNIAADLKKLKPDLAVIHDPQPLAVASYYKDSLMVLRIHIDLSTPNLAVFDFFKNYFKLYPKVVFSLYEYVPRGCKKSRVVISPPAIDPLSSKNKIKAPQKFKKILEKAGVNPSKPLIAQVARFEIWKNPIGALRAYYKAKKYIPDLQIILLGVMEAQDDPGAEEMFKKVKKYAKGDKDIILISQLKDLGVKNDELVCAVQNCANPILQLSRREGFGMTVTEAMWRGKVVIGSNVGGIKFQIEDGKNGFLVENYQEAARRVVEVFKNPNLAEKIGQRAHNSVKRKFLVTRSLKDFLKLYSRLLK